MAATSTVAAAFIILNFFFAYFCLTPRFYRQLLGISTNRNPRQDMAKLSVKAMDEGRLTSAHVERLGRWEACQQNAVENYPLFITAVVFQLLGNRTMNEILGLGVGYTVSRLVFAIAYILTENEILSYGRSVAWWAGNTVCFWAIIVGARGIERSRIGE